MKGSGAGRSIALRHGDYRQVHVAAEQFAFERTAERERTVVIVNSSGAPGRLELALTGRDGETFEDRLECGSTVEVRGGRLRVEVSPCWGRILTRRN